MFSQISFIQWILILWIVLVLLKSIISLFDKEAPDEVLVGVLLILGGGFWLMHSYWTDLSFPWIEWLKLFRTEILVAMLLIIYGVRMVFKSPWKHIIVIMIIGIASFSVNYLKSSFSVQRHSPSGIFLFQPLSLDKEAFRSDSEEGSHLDLILTRGNFTITSSDMRPTLAISSVEHVEESEDNHFLVNSSQTNSEIALSNRITHINVESKMGNLLGEITHSLDEVNAKTYLGEINLQFTKEVQQGRFDSSMGNINLQFDHIIHRLHVKSNAGNIHIKFPRGMKVDVDELKTHLGHISLSNGDGSSGHIKMTGEVTLGNITITVSQ